MPILQNVPIALTAENIIASSGNRRVNPAMLRDAEA